MPLALLLAIAALLSACGGEQGAARRDAAERPPAHAASIAQADVPRSDQTGRVEPHASRSSSIEAVDRARARDHAPPPTGASDVPQARLDGIGPLRLGMSTAEAVRAWPGLYADRPQRIDAQGCDYAQVPGGGLPYVTLKFDRGRFVRYGGSSDTVVAPGGGRRGLPAADLERTYGGALRRVPDPERPRGPGYRLVQDAHGVAPTRLAFVVDGADRVEEWYVGLLQDTDHTLACPD